MLFSKDMHISLNRRRFGALLASLIASPPTLSANKTPPAPQGMPFDEITPRVETDKYVVRLLFSYDCNHCRSYHNAVHEWGESLPKPFRFWATPIVADTNNPNNIMAVYGRIMTEMIDPKALRPYDLMIYELMQGDPSSGKMPAARIRIEDIMSCIVRSGVPAAQLGAFTKSKKVALIEKRLPEHARAISTYGIKATPSIAVGGRYLVTPDHTGGNAQQFVSLLNGIVSRMLEKGSF